MRFPPANPPSLLPYLRDEHATNTISACWIYCREKEERVAAQAKVDANVGLAADREAALRTVDELRRQSKKQEDLFDALVRRTSRCSWGVYVGSCVDYNHRFIRPNGQSSTMSLAKSPIPLQFSTSLPGVPREPTESTVTIS